MVTALQRTLTPQGGAKDGETIVALANVNEAVNELKTLVNQLRNAALYATLGNPGFVIDTNFDVKNGTAFYYTNGGTLKTFAANGNFNTGTAKTVTASLFGAALLSVSAAGAGVVTWASGAGYASEALAIAALPAAAATETPVGYFTIQAHASGFTAGTDALTTGTGGNVCTATTYYNSINPNTTAIGAAVTATELTLNKG
jgi:hypothetical protein